MFRVCRFRGLAAGVWSSSEEALQIAQQAGCSSCRRLEDVLSQSLDRETGPLPAAKQLALASLHDLGELACQQP